MQVTTRPVVGRFQVDPDPKLLSRVEELATELVERPSLQVDKRFRTLRPPRTNDGATLVLDDISAIRIPPRSYDVAFVMDRARLRAGTGDLVASLRAPVPGYETYCRECLGLGKCRWLEPRSGEDPKRLARACWEDTRAFKLLVDSVRSGRLANLDPYQGSPDVWELAYRVSRAAGSPLVVIAPPPGLALFVNSKVCFTETVARLFGPEWVPPASTASRLEEICRQVLSWARRSELIGVKTPDSAGGSGNLVLQSKDFLARSVAATRAELQQRLPTIGWRPGVPVLVGSWLTAIDYSPSAQLWIPPADPPVVEGIYLQLIKGESCEFIGSCPAILPEKMSRQIAHRCWLLAWLFQRLGYVGRCSFDMLVPRSGCQPADFIFVECNGRWGGTSMPMTLMNRLWGDCCRHPYINGTIDLEGLEQLDFRSLLEHFSDDLYDPRTSRGCLIFYNPGRMAARHGIEVIVLEKTFSEARELLEAELPERIALLVTSRT